MRYVKSPSEIAQIRSLMAEPVFADSRVLSIQFETTPEFIAGVLPPGLEPDERPLGSAWVATFGSSNCVGPFDGAGVFVRARHGDLAGNYCLTMPMSTDAAIIFGRELYGEPKKLATIALARTGDTVTGSVTRYGITFIELRARMEELLPAGSGTGSTFHYKYTTAADGRSFDADPVLLHIRGESTTRHAERGAGELIFRESPHDPVVDIPVLRILGASYTEGETRTFGRTLTRVDAEAFLPYAFAKMDDLTLLANTPTPAVAAAG